MKNLLDCINESLLTEAKEDIQRFKITDLKDELEQNNVSKSRIKEIIKYFETVLGEAPYYCISGGNIKGKKSISIEKRYRVGPSITDIHDIEDTRKYFGDDAAKSSEEHNEEVKKFTPEKIQYIKNLEKNIELDIAPFKYGRYSGNDKMYLHAAVGKFEGEYIPVIIQVAHSRGYGWDDILKGYDTTLYVACKNID